MEIKGQCENCGGAFKTTVSQEYINSNDGMVKHPCGKMSGNWDESGAVDVLDKEESVVLDYEELVISK
jgi:hypothetical protein